MKTTNEEQLNTFLRRGLAKFDVISLEFLLPQGEVMLRNFSIRLLFSDDVKFQLYNIDTVYPMLRYLQVIGPESRSVQLTLTGIERLPHLELLHIENIGKNVLFSSQALFETQAMPTSALYFLPHKKEQPSIERSRACIWPAQTSTHFQSGCPCAPLYKTS